MFLLILTGCCSTGSVKQEYFLNPDPIPPAFNNTIILRDLLEDIAALKILAARWKIKSYSDRNIIGEITDDELIFLIEPLLKAIERTETDNE